MAYRCLDCSSTTKARSPDGRCPACGSYNVRSIAASTNGEESDKKPKPYRLVILIILWLFLLFSIARKLMTA